MSNSLRVYMSMMGFSILPVVGLALLMCRATCSGGHAISLRRVLLAKARNQGV